MISDESSFLETAFFQTLGKKAAIHCTTFVSGGCINNTLKVTTDLGTFFLKWNDEANNDLFDKEILGLDLLKNQEVVHTPEVLGTGRADMKNYLVLEYIDKHPPKPSFWVDFGQHLAALHRCTAPQYGLDHDNYIGRLPQSNTPMGSWIDFFIEKRLEVQLQLGIYNRLITKEFAKKFRMIYPQLPGILPDEPASLIHGDLWSGNFMSGPHGNPFVFDPAVYYGHREIELSFTRLFGGFDLRFYQAYHEAFPLEPGFEERIEIYNLYPLLVHVNLFGTSYLSGVERTIRSFV